MSAAHELRPQPASLHTDLNGRLQAQARGMFALLVSMCDGSRKAAALRASVDIRSFDTMRAVPSMDLIARLGRALGLDASAAADAISAGAVSASRAGSGLARECVRDFVREADLDDDAFALECAAEVLAKQAALPCDLALAHLVRVRAMVARGAHEPAMHTAEIALDIGLASDSDGAHDAIVAQLAESIVFESMLGSPCEARPLRSDAASDAASGAVAATLARLLSASTETAAEVGSEHALVIIARRNAWRLARSVLTSTGSSVDGLQELRAATERASERLHAATDDPHSRRDAERALAWTASIAAIAALRLHAAGSCSQHAMSTIVSAELALDDVLAEAVREDSSHEALAPSTRALFARRARVAMCEWSTRAELGEIDARTIDGIDLDELVRSSLLFPRARTSRVFDQVNRANSRGEMQRVRKFTLDALSSDCWMLQQVPCLTASWAVGSRSEDSC